MLKAPLLSTPPATLGLGTSAISRGSGRASRGQGGLGIGFEEGTQQHL